MMLLGAIKIDGETQICNLYNDWHPWLSDTFSPTTEIITQILFTVKGKTYNQKKAYLKDLAIDFQSADTMGLSWGEYAEITSFFEKNAKRYGLVKEFKENGII